MDAIHPDERRLLSYAGDSAVHVKSEDENRDEPYSRVRIYKGMMELTQELHRTSKFTVRNADTKPRLVVLEYPAQQGWNLSDSTPKPEESTESYHRFRVPVDGGKIASLTVETIHAQETSYSLTNLDSNFVALLVREKRVTPTMKLAFENIMLQKGKISALHNEIAKRKTESDRISTDQNRIRENMKALKGSSEEKALVQRYVGQLDSQETRLEALRKEMDDLTAQENQANAELERMIMEVNVDEKF
jgi:hypothetical protein